MVFNVAVTDVTLDPLEVAAVNCNCGKHDTELRALYPDSGAPRSRALEKLNFRVFS